MKTILLLSCYVKQGSYHHETKNTGGGREGWGRSVIIKGRKLFSVLSLT